MGDGALTIGLVLDDGLDRPDGVQQYVLTLGGELAARGHDVHYLTSSTRRTDLPGLHVLGTAATVTFNGNRLGSPLPVPSRTVRSLLARVPFDVLHVQMPYSPLLAGRVVSRAQSDVAVIGTFHIYPQSGLVAAGTRLLGRLESRRLRRFDAVLAASEAAQSFAATAFGMPSRVVGNPVDLRRFVAAAPPPGTPASPVHIVFLGRLVPRKGPRELLAAAVQLTERGTRTPWTLTIAGRGPLRAELAATVDRAGLADRVTLPGFVPEEDKAALLAAADIVVLPSTGGESFGISVVEALAGARGVVLAGDNPGYRTTMLGLADQLLDARDPSRLAATLARWVDDAPARAAAAPRQRAAARRFDVGVITDAVEETYRQALARRRG